MIAINSYKRPRIPTRLPIYLAPKRHNQSPVTVYGGIYTASSTVTYGQVSVLLKGLTATNAVKNGNFANGTTGWTPLAASVSAANNTLTITGNGSEVQPRVAHTVFADTSHKWYARAKARVTNSNCQYIRLQAATSVNFQYVQNPVQNQWYILSGVVSNPSMGSNLHVVHEYADASTANGKVMEVQEVMAIDLTATFGAGNEPTKEQCDAMFPVWFDGTKSTVSSWRVQSKDASNNVISTAYAIAKDNDGNIIQLRRLPNGTADEINAATGTLTIKTKKKVITADDVVSLNNMSYTNVDRILISKPDDFIGYNNYTNYNTAFVLDKYPSKYVSNQDDLANIGYSSCNVADKQIAIYVAKGTYVDLADAKTQLAAMNLTLTYQLATPIISYHPDTDIQIGPSWTLQLEPYDVGPEDTTIPTMDIYLPLGIHMPIQLAGIDVFNPLYLDQDFRLG